jgi:hypothetical protein
LRIELELDVVLTGPAVLLENAEPRCREAWSPSSPFRTSLVRASGAGVVAHGKRLVNFPLRVVLALVVIGAVTAIGVWALVTVLRIKSMTEAQRMMTVAGIVTIAAALTAWVIFLWPAYWD